MFIATILIMKIPTGTCQSEHCQILIIIDLYTNVMHFDD